MLNKRTFFTESNFNDNNKRWNLNMGTSKRRIENKVKQILSNNPIESLNNYAPKITEVILSPQNLTETFQEEHFSPDTFVLIEKHFSTLKSSGFGGKSKEEIQEDLITQEEFLNSILELIEDNFEIDSKILLKSFKITMAKFIKGDFDVYSFAQLLFYEVVSQLLLKDLQDTLKDSYEDLSYSSIQDMVASSTSCIMSEEVFDKINDFVNKRSTLSEVLTIIHSKTSEALFGDF